MIFDSPETKNIAYEELKNLVIKETEIKLFK